jgi:putative nucleotidyltransferase with HDIG domain
MTTLRPRVTTYVYAVLITAVVMLSAANWQAHQQAAGFWTAFASLLGLALVAELFSTRLTGNTATTTAVSFVPYIASIVLLGGPWPMAIAGLTEFVAETIVRRKEPIRVVHNTAKEIVAIGSASYAYVWLGGIPSVSGFGFHFIPFLSAAALYFVISNGSVATAMALSVGHSLHETWGRAVGKTILFDLFASSLALLLAYLYSELQVLGVALVLIPLFFVRHSNHINRELEQTNRDLLELMVKAIEARDPYTSGHSQRVAEIAGALAREIDLGFREVETISTAALLHDVGKIYEEFAPLLRKQGRLTDGERNVMESHPARSAELVSTISGLRGHVEECVRHHHECYDGTGYPQGLAGGEIPLGARIVMIADTTDAMTTDRPYRRALVYESVVAELERHSGTQFDPDLVDAFRRSAAIRAMVSTRGRAVAPIAKPKPPKRKLRIAR